MTQKMNTREIIEYCKKWGVDVDRSQASRWIKEYDSGGGTKSLVVMLRAMVAEGKYKDLLLASNAILDSPEVVEAKERYVEQVLDGVIKVVPLIDMSKKFAPEDKPVVKRHPKSPKNSTPPKKSESFPIKPKPDENLPVTPAVERIVSSSPGYFINEKGWKMPLLEKSEKKVVDDSVKVIEPMEMGRAESVPNGWKFDPVLRKTGFVWNEVIYSHKGFLEVGTIVRLNGDTVELGLQGSLKLISE